MMQQIRVWELGIPEDSWGFVCVEKIDNMDVEVPLQPFSIHLGAMHDLDNILVLDDLL